jgi:hypothetical protein
MNKTYILAAALMIAAATSCKKPSTKDPVDNNPPRVSQKALLCNTWILSETYEDDVQKTSNGNGKYQFTKEGEFQYWYNNAWNKLGTYTWNDKDSNSISVLFSGASMSYWWHIKKLDDKNYNTEFFVDGKKLNYNYTR